MQNQDLAQYISPTEEHKLLSDEYINHELENGQELQMNDENARLLTFISWPNEDIIASNKLAKAGFYYKKNGDEVQCFSCGGKIRGWQSGDVAVRKHKELFPKCNFIAEIFNKASKRHNIGLNNISLQVPQNLISATSQTNARLALSNGQASSSEQIIASSSVNQINVRNNRDETSRTFDFEKLKFESERLKTFTSWPLENPKPCDLAREGFFYLGEADKVQCVFCQGVVSHWESDDIPLREHAKHFPFCPFIFGRDVGNVPINSTQTSRSFTRGVGQDECGFSMWERSAPENGYKCMRKPSKLENFGVKLHHGPRHPAQASKDARMRSFVTWPTSSALKPEELVDAGFFFIGIKDYTRCFYCDGGLCNWEEGDDPWVEHAKWFQNCAYIRLNKGDDFVESCLNTLSQNPVNQTPIESTANEPLHVSAVSENLQSKLDEYLASSVVKSALEPGIFPAHLIREVLVKRIEKGENNFRNADDLCGAVLNLQQEMENNFSPESAVNRNEEPMDDEEFNVVVRNEKIPSENIPLKITSPITENINGSMSVDDLLKEQRLCKICMDKEIGVLFLPCGHLMACVQCAPAMSDCPFCRKPIKGTVRAFLT